MGVNRISFDFVGLLEELTGRKDWRESAGPDSGCGLDYWYEAGGGAKAYINVDQNSLVVCVEDELRLEGDYTKNYFLKRRVRA